MQIITIGLDIAKNVFQVHGIDADEKVVVRKQLRRSQIETGLLDLYDRQRRHAAVTYVQAQTMANKRLMEERDPAVRKTNFDKLRRTADDPEAARLYMRRAALLDSLRDAASVT
jgi:hypothetical protein